MSISSVRSCPSNRRRQATPACTQVSRRKTEPSLWGQCVEEACQSTLARGATPNPASQPRRPNLVEPAIRLHSCVEQLAAHTTVHSAPRQAAVNHHFACPEHYCTIIVSTSETTPSQFYRTRASGYLGTVQQVKRDIYREVDGRAPDRRVHFTSCRRAGLHRATRHTKASQRPVTPVRSSQRCAAARSTRARYTIRFGD